MVLAESSRDAGAIAGPARPRGRPAADPRDAQIARLRKEKAQLEQELASAGRQAILDVLHTGRFADLDGAAPSPLLTIRPLI